MKKLKAKPSDEINPKLVKTKQNLRLESSKKK